MAVLGIACNWSRKRISYAVLDGTLNNLKEIDVDEFKLSEDVDVNLIENLTEVGKRISDLLKIYPINKICLFWPSGLEKPMKRPEWRSPDPMKLRLEGSVAGSIGQFGIHAEVKGTRKIASDLGVGQKGDPRWNILRFVESKLPASNDDKRYAVAAALSILG